MFLFFFVSPFLTLFLFTVLCFLNVTVGFVFSLLFYVVHCFVIFLCFSNNDRYIFVQVSLRFQYSSTSFQTSFFLDVSTRCFFLACTSHGHIFFFDWCFLSSLIVLPFTICVYLKQSPCTFDMKADDVELELDYGWFSIADRKIVFLLEVI